MRNKKSPMIKKLEKKGANPSDKLMKRTFTVAAVTAYLCFSGLTGDRLERLGRSRWNIPKPLNTVEAIAYGAKEFACDTYGSATKRLQNTNEYLKEVFSNIRSDLKGQTEPLTNSKGDHAKTNKIDFEKAHELYIKTLQ